ncbi:monovalent cation:H+ antiporter-2, CPA2 family [Pseudomonas citronellolis]|uniref:Monovalent cation:H+ antiporter-2, CPA2 family n=1 Tax=Pseudomonas citronellolis TaxID=53408 RepID=A0AAQ1HUP1_9PSED|nr:MULTISPECIES: YbaL family putative K(+) efflux transporter [Pseudomonas]MCL6689985.1 Kef family K(+) transporter [Pseudomonas sp. R3.Fl]MCP1606756.1 CPA2 family monovalent cation:H+ antiporter-2 [Pseudomonas citronellolis]MCP1641423.1 CPA2 family monovalent cation:H+ antiporter-2 [Pseudomonas citronellolis]MCP1657463.1 CPA2 family monovalent cation:H+ antiporter-2 [Pseudomonas citronellolis]MCP1664341.1 CPA2 family monovalent cation:H+ antiporter-2 [Pseudomonas citronellolis]
MHHTPLLTTLAVGFVLAFILGALANRLRISPLVGYLLAGVLAGPFTPGYVADQALSTEIAELGVILLMFGVGLHFSLKDLLSVKAIAIPGAVVQIGVATLLGMGLAWMMGWPLGGGLVFGLALSVASTVVLLRALEQRQLIDTKRGRIAIGWLIVEDLAMVLTLVLLPALAGTLGGKAEDGASGGILLPILLTLGKVVAFVAVMILGGRRVVPWALEKIAATGSRELFTLAVLAIALGIATGSAVVFGVSFALGAFFAGMILNESELSHEAAENSLPLRDAFAVLFFVSVGMLFNPAILIHEPLPVLATFLVIVFGKSVAAYVIVRLFGHPNSTALTIAASLAQIGEFSFILVGLGVTLELLPEQGRDLVLAGAILSILVNPLLFIAIERLQARKEGAQPSEAQAQDEDLPPPVREHEHAILIGHGRVGELVSARLQKDGTPLVVIEDKREKAAELRERGLSVVVGNAANPEVLALANITTARWLLIAIPNGFEAGQIASRARAANPELDIIARAHFDAEVEYLEQNGANLVIMGEREIAQGMYQRVEQQHDTPAPQPDGLPQSA